MQRSLKHSLETLIAQNKLAEAIEALQNSAAHAELAELEQALLQQSAIYHRYQIDLHDGTVDQRDLDQTSNKISKALIFLVDQWSEFLEGQAPLPEPVASPAPAAKPKGVAESTLKNQLMLLLLGLKLGLVAYLSLHWSTRGFTLEQFTSTLGLIIAPFTPYLTLAIKDFSARDQQDPRKVGEPRRSRLFQRLSIGLLLLYAWLLYLLINLKTTGSLSQAAMIGLITALEGILGIYLGTLLFSLFKHQE